MRNYSDTKANKTIIILLVFITIIAFLFLQFRSQINLHIKEICEYKSRETANKIITTVIDNELKGSADKDYITVQKNKNDEIVSIETNTKEINKLQSDLKSKINDTMAQIPDYKIYIPLGTLSGITFLSGRGPDVNLKLHQVGSTDTKIISEFASAGINQTRHRIILRVIIELSAILPLHSTNVTVKNDYIISETVIVGKVPNGLISTNKT